ncbi:MAG: hypothetical protein OHK93_003925 [Ramalina farinacea]|uniref:Uncharacterized protein n=1 Tax=Ramalina farinacea TaxID=258253 RepID=A0AA43QFS9_9LECA|nr:hypothetical protein [Ramalina farinacea]
MYDTKPVEESESSEDQDEEEHDDEEIETTSTKRQLGTDSDDGEDTEGGYSQAKAANKAPPAKKQVKGKTPGRKTTTSKQTKKYEQRKAVDESMGNWGFELMARWKCDLPGCNKNKYCYQPYGRGGDHYPMNNDDITRWNREIQSDEDQFDLVSSEKPSQGLNETFLKRARIIRMANARKKEDKELTSPKTPCPDPAPPAPVAAPSMPSATTTPLTADEQLRWFKAGQEAAGGLNSGLFGQQASELSSSLFLSGPLSLRQQLQMLQQLQQIQQFQGQLQQLLLPQIPALPIVNRQQIPSTPPKKLPSRPSTASQALSSPVKHSGDIDKALRDYIAWQCQRFPSQSERLEHAYEALSAKDYTLVDIQRFDNAKWKELGITYGIGARLRREIKEFQKAVAARAPLQTAPGLDILAEAIQSHGQNDGREY